MTVKVILKYWKDYVDHWDYVTVDGAYLIARIRLDGPPNDTYKNGVYVTTHYWCGDPKEFVDSADLELNKKMVELDYEEYLKNWTPK